MITGDPLLVVIGSANIDVVMRVERRPGPGETVMCTDVVTTPGGKGANQAVAAARLGAQVAFVGTIGADAHGERLLASLTAAGVNTEFVSQTDRAATGTAVVIVTPDGENAIVVGAGANAFTDSSVLDRAAEAFARARGVLVQMEIPLEAIRDALKRTEPDCRFILNAAPPMEVPADVITRCDPLVVNEHEAAVLLNGVFQRPEVAVRRLRSLGARSVVVTCGAAGAYISSSVDGPTGDEALHVPAPRVTPVDTTGAGDAFLGALAWRLGLGDDLHAAARFAVRVGSSATLHAGAQASYPFLHEVVAETKR